ncbi:MAG: glycosyltransferase family 9 protein, partial [Bacteroidota bacterium]
SFKNLTHLKNHFLPPTPSRGGEASLDVTNYLALPIGAGLATKSLTVEKIVTICQSIDYPIVLLGGKKEIEKGQQIEKKLTHQKNIFNLVGRCSLLESAAIVEGSKLVLTGDTGLMHIAAAFRKPIISVWGNTVPEFGMTPYYPKGMDLNRTIEVKGLACRPCSKIGFGACPKGHFRCIEDLETARVIAIINQIWTTHLP